MSCATGRYVAPFSRKLLTTPPHPRSGIETISLWPPAWTAS